MKRFRLWFMTKKMLVTQNLRLLALYRDQQNALERLTRVTEELQGGAPVANVMRAFYDLPRRPDTSHLVKCGRCNGTRHSPRHGCEAADHK